MNLLRTWFTPDTVALFAFALSYLGYPLLGRLRGRRGAERGTHGAVLRELRGAAARTVDSASGPSLLVASFQAWVRSLIFLGTAALLALGGSLGLFLNPQRAGQLCQSSVFAESTSAPDVVRVRMLVFALLAGYAFLQCVWGLKALHHLTFAVHGRDPALVGEFLGHLDHDFSRGVRTLYYVSVLFLWFFGPEYLLAGTVALTVMLWRFDSRVIRK